MTEEEVAKQQLMEELLRREKMAEAGMAISPPEEDDPNGFFKPVRVVAPTSMTSRRQEKEKRKRRERTHVAAEKRKQRLLWRIFFLSIATLALVLVFFASPFLEEWRAILQAAEAPVVAVAEWMYQLQSIVFLVWLMLFIESSIQLKWELKLAKVPSLSRKPFRAVLFLIGPHLVTAGLLYWRFYPNLPVFSFLASWQAPAPPVFDLGKLDPILVLLLSVVGGLASWICRLVFLRVWK